MPTVKTGLRELVRKALGEPESSVAPLDEARDLFMKEYLQQTLRIAKGNVSRAARLAGRNRTDFYKLMRRYRLPMNSSNDG